MGSVHYRWGSKGIRFVGDTGDVREVGDSVLEISESFCGGLLSGKESEATCLQRCVADSSKSGGGGASVAARISRFASAWEGIGANSLELQWIGDGVTIEPLQDPVGSRFPSNRIAEGAQRLFVAKELAALLASGAIEQCADESMVRHVMPMFLVKKASGSFRPVFNAKRLNEMLVVPSFRFESLSAFTDQLGRGCSMTKLNLSSGYHHVALAREARQWTGFRFGGCLFRWRVLFFGLASAPFFFQKLMRIPVRYLRQQGHTIGNLLDDFAVAAPSLVSCASLLRSVQHLFADLGLFINRKKSVFIPLVRMEFLGFVLDTHLG